MAFNAQQISIMATEAGDFALAIHAIDSAGAFYGGMASGSNDVNGFILNFR